MIQIIYMKVKHISILIKMQNIVLQVFVSEIKIMVCTMSGGI